MRPISRLLKKCDLLTVAPLDEQRSVENETPPVTDQALQCFDYKGHRHRASKDAPQYEIKSDKTDHIAAHKEVVLTKI